MPRMRAQAYPWRNDLWRLRLAQRPGQLTMGFQVRATTSVRPMLIHRHIGGPPELDKHAISVAEGAGKIPPYPFARHLYLCACSRGRLRKSLDDPQMFGAKMPKPWFKTPILTPAGELELGEHFQVDFKWWAKECSKRGLVVRPDPKADRRTLTEVLAAPAEEAQVHAPGASGHRVLRG